MLTSGRLIKYPIVWFDGNGVITRIEENVENIDSQEGVEFYNGILIPGTVNCHCHLEYSYVKGMIPRNGGLPEFIRTIIDIKRNASISEKEKTDAAQVWDAMMYNDGIVAVADHNNNDYVYSVKKKSRIYYHNLVEIFDEDNQTAEETFRQGMRRVNESRSYGFASTSVPHANYTMEDKVIKLAGGVLTSEDGVTADGIVSVHFKESVAMGGPGELKSIVEGISPKRDRILLVHTIYATPEDIDAVKEKFGDRVVAVPCPLSNIYIEQRLPDIEVLREKGVTIALGTDGLSSNDTLSMVEEIKCVQKHLPHIPLTEIVMWATKNGAEALGISDWAGSFEVGKRPGAVLLTGVDFETMSLTDDTKGKRII